MPKATAAKLTAKREAAAKAEEVGEIRMALDAVERLGRQLTAAMMKSAGANQNDD